MEEYLKKLIEQYKQATGTRNIDTNSRTFISEFYNWIEERKKQGIEYLSLLDYMELDKFYYSDSYEIGKGQYDTLVKKFDTTIITPYTEGIIVPEERIINSNFFVWQGVPVLLENPKKGVTDIKTMDCSIEHTFMTQNPYTPGNIEDWEQIHNNSENSIIVGMYGSIYDKDLESKIQQLKTLRDKLYEPFKEEYFTTNGIYGYVVATEKEPLNLVRRLRR